MKKISLLLVLSFLIFSCVNHVDVKECLPIEEPSGFWGGTWDGMIMVPSFIGSIIWDDVAVYDVNNNGAWYDFGFVGGFFFMIRLIRFTVEGNKKTRK